MILHFYQLIHKLCFQQKLIEKRIVGDQHRLILQRHAHNQNERIELAVAEALVLSEISAGFRHGRKCARHAPAICRTLEKYPGFRIGQKIRD